MAIPLKLPVQQPLASTFPKSCASRRERSTTQKCSTTRALDFCYNVVSMSNNIFAMDLANILHAEDRFFSVLHKNSFVTRRCLETKHSLLYNVWWLSTLQTKNNGNLPVHSQNVRVYGEVTGISRVYRWVTGFFLYYLSHSCIYHAKFWHKKSLRVYGWRTGSSWLKHPKSRVFTPKIFYLA